ncbi:hypothetical protein ACMYSK_04170 [Klebsiella sp. I138]|uniref:hypothetical protein n=1 Tax=Klebsiella sp. I138 TaxID=2755385 RepID=UPI003DA8B2A8
MLLSDFTACYHRLIYYGRSNGSLGVDSFSPSQGAVSAAMSYLIIILICAYYSVDDHGGKYQKAILSANAICKYVTGFSFMVFSTPASCPVFWRENH